LFEDLKERAINNFEYIKGRFSNGNESVNEKKEKID